MALIECPECKGLVSDKATACVKCSFEFVVACSECGSDIHMGALACPQCGCPLKELVKAADQANVNAIQRIMVKAHFSEQKAELEKAKREAIRPDFNGIYVSQQCTKRPRVYGFLKHGWRRAYIQFFSDGSAFYHDSVVTPFEVPTDAAITEYRGYLQEVVRSVPQTKYTWEMQVDFIVLKDQQGAELISKIEEGEVLKVVDPSDNTATEYTFVRTQLKLR